MAYRRLQNGLQPVRYVLGEKRNYVSFGAFLWREPFWLWNDFPKETDRAAYDAYQHAFRV